MQTHPRERAAQCAKSLCTEPFLKWPGGKRLLADTIIELLPSGRRLIEPFVGAGALFARSAFNSYVVSDVNQDLSSLYEILRDSPVELLSCCASLFDAVAALADAAASGKIMQTLMTRDNKYPPAYAAALTCVSSIIGPIIPPSIPLVLFALVSDTSIGFLFLGGIIPGLLLGAVQMGLVGFTAKRRGFPVEKRVPLRELPRITWEATPALLMPVILLGCMYSGITTPTEAAAVAAFYALLLSWLLYRSLTLGGVYRSLVASARPTVSISMLIAGALVFNFVITSENIPKTLSAMLATWEMSPYVFLFAVNVLLLVLGCFLEGTTIILVILPVLLPTAQHLGVDMVHFGVMCVINIMIGLVTPPYGLLLFMMNKIANISLREMVVELLPFLYVTLGALALITYVPGFVLWLPRLMGYTG